MNLNKRSCLIAVLGWAAFVMPAMSDVGEKLYSGEIELHATLGTGRDEISADAAKCVNCHGKDGKGIAESGIRGSDIRRSVLTKVTGRRGGPPVPYSEATFCDALRLGHDAAGVVLSRAMPRYRVSSAECRALWNYLDEVERRRR